MSNIINLMADGLKNYIDKPPILIRGLVKLAAGDVFPNINVDTLSLDDWKKVIQKGISERMKMIGKDSQKACQDLLSMLIKNQSLIAMNNF